MGLSEAGHTAPPAADQQTEPAYAECTPEHAPEVTVAEEAPPDGAAAGGDQGDPGEPLPPPATKGGISKGKGRKSLIGRMFSRKGKKSARAGTLGPTLMDEAVSKTACTFYGSAVVDRPCGGAAVAHGLDALYYVEYAHTAKIAGAQLDLNQHRAIVTDMHGDLLSESPLYSISYVYTDPETHPRILAFIAASLNADDRFLCTVVETADDAAGLRRSFEASLAISDLPVRYDGPHTFAANNHT